MANTVIGFEESITKLLKAHLKQEIDKAVEKEITTAKEKVEAEIRKSAAMIALSTFHTYDVYRDGDSLMIKIQNGDMKRPPTETP